MVGDGELKRVKVFQVAVSVIRLNHVRLLIFYWFHLQ